MHQGHFAHIDNEFADNENEALNANSIDLTDITNLIDSLKKIIRAHVLGVGPHIPLDTSGLMKIFLSEMIRNLHAGRSKNYPHQDLGSI